MDFARALARRLDAAFSREGLRREAPDLGAADGRFRGSGDPRNGRGDEPVLVARQPVDRVLRGRQAEARAGRRRAGPGDLRRRRRARRDLERGRRHRLCAGAVHGSLPGRRLGRRPGDPDEGGGRGTDASAAVVSARRQATCTSRARRRRTTNSDTSIYVLDLATGQVDARRAREERGAVRRARVSRLRARRQPSRSAVRPFDPEADGRGDSGRRGRRVRGVPLDRQLHLFQQGPLRVSRATRPSARAG